MRQTQAAAQAGGRGAVSQEKGLPAHLHQRHGHVTLDDIVTPLGAAGLAVRESGAVGFRSLQYVLATAPR